MEGSFRQCWLLQNSHKVCFSSVQTNGRQGQAFPTCIAQSLTTCDGLEEGRTRRRGAVLGWGNGGAAGGGRSHITRLVLSTLAAVSPPSLSLDQGQQNHWCRCKEPHCGVGGLRKYMEIKIPFRSLPTQPPHLHWI